MFPIQVPQLGNLTYHPLDLNQILQVKDVRVPEQLMRAMAAEAEAARNARAKVSLVVTVMAVMLGMVIVRAIIIVVVMNLMIF